MPLTCGVCKDQCVAGGADFVNCSGVCQRSLHVKCITDEVGRKPRTGDRRQWKCKSCQAETTNQDAPVTREFIKVMLDDFQNKISDTIKSVKNEVSELRASVQHLSDNVDTNNNLLKQTQEEIKVVRRENTELKKNLAAVTATMSDLQERVRVLEQYTRRNNVEIAGIPVTPREDVVAIVKDVAEVLGVAVQDDQISAAHRVPSFNKDRTPSLVVQFHNRALRDSLVQHFRDKKVLTASEVNPALPSSKIYVGEHLSPENKQFLAKLKKKCEEIGYNYAWCREGKFFVRKMNGEKCRKINSYAELNNLK